MPNEELNYEQDLDIDPDALDVEWLRQPRLFMKWAELYAEAKAAEKEAKQNMEVVDAQMSTVVRLNPEEHLGELKVTETSIANAVKLTPECDKARKIYVKAVYRAELLKNAVAAFDQRKTALEELVKLHGQNYFSGPSVPRNIHIELDRRKAVSKEVNKRTKERLSTPKRKSKK